MPLLQARGAAGQDAPATSARCCRVRCPCYERAVLRGKMPLLRVRGAVGQAAPATGPWCCGARCPCYRPAVLRGKMPLLRARGAAGQDAPATGPRCCVARCPAYGPVVLRGKMPRLRARGSAVLCGKMPLLWNLGVNGIFRELNAPSFPIIVLNKFRKPDKVKNSMLLYHD